MKLFIVGQKLFGAAVLQLCLHRGHEVLGVCSPLWSSNGERPDRLRFAAVQAGIDCLDAGALRAETLPAGVDLILAAHALDYIGRRARQRARLGAIGFHPSLLPVHRGRDAVRWAVRLHEQVTGGTIYWLGDSVDAGDIAAQEHAFIRPDDTPEELWRRELFPLGVRLFDSVLADIDAGRLVKVPQDESAATWEPALDAQPLFRPELPLLGSIAGFDVVRDRKELSDHFSARDERAMRDSSTELRTLVNHESIPANK